MQTAAIDDVLFCIAKFIKPNPFIYLRLSTVNKSWHRVFTSDEIWRHLNPEGHKSNFAYHFISILSNHELFDTFMYWNVHSIAYHPPRSDDPYSWLGLISNHTIDHRWYQIQDPPFYTTSKHLLWCAINLNPHSLQCASQTLRDDQECVQLAVSKAGCCLKWASPRLQNDPNLVLQALRTGCTSSCRAHGGTAMPLYFGSEELKSDFIFAHQAVAINGLSLKHFSPTLRADRRLVLSAIENDPKSIKYTRLRHDKTVALAALALDGTVIKYLTSFADDPEVIKRAVEYRGDLIQYASARLRDDYSIAKLAVSKFPFAICYLGPKLRYCAELAKQAVSQDGLVLKELPEWCGNREVAYCAVKQNAEALLFASPRLQECPRFILRIVATNGMALKYVAYDLRNKSDVALAAATQSGKSIVEYLDDSWRGSRQLILAAIQTYPQALNWASEELKSDPEILEKFQRIHWSVKCI